MPWDSSLNNDLHHAIARHVSACFSLREGDPGYFTRFTLYTPSTQDSAYLRILDQANGLHGGSPTSDRICQDISKFVSNLKGIRNARGCCVQGLGNRNGHRALGGNKGRQPRGGKRTKTEQGSAAPWLHPDAHAAAELFMARAITRHTGAPAGVNQAAAVAVAAEAAAVVPAAFGGLDVLAAVAAAAAEVE